MKEILNNLRTAVEESAVSCGGVKIIDAHKVRVLINKAEAEWEKEYGKEPSRCDTCTHDVVNKVPPICYLCSKGIEDNYTKKEVE